MLQELIDFHELFSEQLKQRGVSSNVCSHTIEQLTRLQNMNLLAMRVACEGVQKVANELDAEVLTTARNSL